MGIRIKMTKDAAAAGFDFLLVMGIKDSLDIKLTGRQSLTFPRRTSLHQRSELHTLGHTFKQHHGCAIRIQLQRSRLRVQLSKRDQDTHA